VPEAADVWAIKRPNFVPEGGCFLYKQRPNLVPEVADVWAINWPKFVPEGGRFLYKQAAEFSARSGRCLGNKAAEFCTRRRPLFVQASSRI